MIKKFLILTGRLAMYVAIFFGLVWYLLGIEPKEAWETSVKNIQLSATQMGGFLGDMTTTGKSMNQTANNHLNKAADRINGIDPYEAEAKKFNDQVRDYVNERQN